MAAVPVTLIGAVTYDNGTVQNITFSGVAAIAGLGVGGGPIVGYPAHPIAPGGAPPHVDIEPPKPQPPAGGGEHPAHPIELPPVEPGGPPVEIWPKPPGGQHPEHPIVLPPEPPDVTPSPPGIAVKPPPADGGWAYVRSWGWGYFPGPGQASPK